MRSQADSLRDFVMRRPRPLQEPLSTPVIVVAAGKGGVGTSTLSMLLGISVAAQDVETLLVDAAGTPGSLAVLLNTFGLDPEQENPELHTIAPRLTLARPVAPAAPPVEAERRIRYRRLASRFNQFDCVIVDAGSRLDMVTMTLADSSRLLLVSTDDRVSVTATYAMFKHACEVRGTVRTSILVNRSNREGADRAWGVLRTGTERFLGNTLDGAVSVPDDAALQGCMNEGTFLKHAADTTACAAIQPMALELVAESSKAFSDL